MKKYILFFISILFIFVMFACRDKTDLTDQGFTIDDFYDQVVIYETRINLIVNQTETESLSKAAKSNLSSVLDAETTTIMREDILAAHNRSTFDMVNDDYVEQLLTTQLFVTELREMLEQQSGITLNEPFHPTNDTSLTYTLVMSDTGYILIDTLDAGHHSYLKLGLNDDLLDYQEFHYAYNSDSMNPREDIELNFNYFKFLENKEAVYVNYLTNQSSLRYTSIENDEQFTISSGSGVIEDELYQENGYVLNMYDRDTNSQIYLQLINDEIVSETYDVFDEHGLVYRYSDADFFDNTKRLQINFVTATGWDYVVVSDGSSPEIDPLTGIFTSDGTKLYDDFFNYTYTPDYGYLGLRIDLDQQAPLTDELFSLNQYGLNFEHPKANMNFLSQVKPANINTIKSRFAIQNLNFFAEDLHAELYHYVDQDIRNDLEGVNVDPIVTTGDVEDFNQALVSFNDNLSNAIYYQSTTSTAMNIFDGDAMIGTSTILNTVKFDSQQLFYSDYTSVVGDDPSHSYTYVIDGTHGKLIEFDIEGHVVDYRVLAPEANRENFMTAYQTVLSDEPLSGIINIEKMDPLTFELLVNSSFLSSNGVDINTVYEQEGISGFDQQTFIVTFSFETGFAGLTMSYEVMGLMLNDYDVTLSGVSSIEQTPFVAQSPLVSTAYLFNMPSQIDDIIFTYVLGLYHVNVPQGTRYMALELEAGEYSVDVYGMHYVADVTIYDASFNELSYDQRFNATYDGIYYVAVNAPYTQTADIYIRSNRTPEFYHLMFEDTDDTLEMDIWLSNIVGSDISVPTSSDDRLLMIRPYFIDPVQSTYSIDLMIMVESIGYFDGFMIGTEMNFEDTCYFYLPKNETILIELSGDYEGMIGFEYQYEIIPNGVYDNVYDWIDLSVVPHLWMNEDNPIAHVNFIIDETGDYLLDVTYKDFFGSASKYAKLYTSEGTLIDGDWEDLVTLTAGDYYIEFTQPGFGEMFVLIMPEIIKQ